MWYKLTALAQRNFADAADREKEVMMNKAGTSMTRLAALVSFAGLVLLSSVSEAQVRPNLFRQRPISAAPSRHGTLAQIGDVDEALLTTDPEGISVPVPGSPDIEIERQGHERRGARRMVWRGRTRDRHGKATLTLHEGLLFGHVQRGSDIYVIRPGANGRTIVEKIDSDSFAPEWGHDAATHGHDKIPPAMGERFQQNSPSAPASTASDATIQIVLMSVYTPQARAAAGGTAQIEGQIQAAVDQANSAFINSNMIARFYLSHAEEVAYNDSGNIETDLNWVTGNSTVASLRNTHSADMVSLITNNGGGYCGIAWVQRNPGAGFANYAFQVTALGCLANATLAHEHGHNMGMEHDPASAGISPTGASYPWSFGHYVNGSFRTIMSYNVCSISCPRVLHFSNPDVLYNDTPTGVLDQRDNAQTGDLTAPIVANFRAGEGSATNNPPTFTSDPIVNANANQGLAYAGTISSSASDTDSDPLSFAKVGGPAWLSVASNGSLIGTPGAVDVGLNTFTVSVSDDKGGSDTATLQITVIGQLTAPSNLAGTPVGIKRIDLNWTDNAFGETGFKIERSTNGTKFSQIATVGASATTYSNASGLRRGKIYYYRVRAYNSTGNSPYSNTISVKAN
jgi:hypothetical protein